MICFSHPTGNANVRHAALALAEADLLDEFWTCLAWNEDSVLNDFLPRRLRESLSRRSVPGKLWPYITMRPLRELGRLFGANSALPVIGNLVSIDAVYEALDRAVARRVESASGLKAVYCYEDGAGATFKAAKQRQLRCIYDLPIGYWRAAHAIYDEESARAPEWARTLTGRDDSPEKLARKDEELRAADQIVVASSFTKETLKSAVGLNTPVTVIPYGSPACVENIERAPGGQPLRVLFVGSLGQRKGLSYLLNAVEPLGEITTLTLLGRKTVDHCAPLDEATQKHHWIPTLSNAQVLEEMRRHDVLVFPSLFEGFGLVILEAMSQGLPVITTAHTAGPDLIQHGKSGFVVPIRSAEEITMHLEQLERDREQLYEMKLAARDAAARFTWEKYRHRLSELVAAALKSAP